VIARELDFDPDIWVVVVEDRAGRAPFEVTPEPSGRPES